MTGRYQCPYTAGAEFEMILRHRYSDLFLCHIRIRLCQTYPFTKSQGMKVEILNCDDDQVPLPRIAFLKLYDRRYIDDRALDERNPWTQEKEEQAKKVARKIQPLFPDPEVLLRGAEIPSVESQERRIVFERPKGYDEEDYEEALESLSSAESDAIKQWKIEMWYRYRTTSWFQTECRAYRQLETLQGNYVPKFYGATLFDKTAPLPTGVDTDVLGILLEFIEEVTLEELDLESNLAKNNPHIGQAAVSCFERIIPFGVLHGDPRLPNIMLRADGQVCLIDFAQASFRGDGFHDQDWEDLALGQQETDLIKRLLDNKELRDRTPPLPYLGNMNDYRNYNSEIERARESWRSKYYDHISEDVIDVVSHADDEGQERLFLLPSWLPKYEKLLERVVSLRKFRYRASEWKKN
jgi:hypothetical protein